MYLTIVNGSNPDPRWKPYDDALLRLVEKLRSHHHVDYFTIKNMKLNPCTGCWDCWVKTPGVCMHKDDGPSFQKSLAHTEGLLFFSPVVCGFISSETKKALDRFIPSALPYIRIHEGECHHLPRYQDPKLFGLFLYDTGDLDPEALHILENYSDRLQKNIKANKKWFRLVNPENMEVLSNEISNS